jgi:hypothetical protein
VPPRGHCDGVSADADTARNPTDREALSTHWKKIMIEPTCLNRTIVCDGQVVGSVSSYVGSGGP